jgi:electron transfer flavoprotein alpha subunit
MSTIIVATEIREGQLKSINQQIFTAAVQIAKELNLSTSAVLLGTQLDSLSDIPGKFGIQNTIVVEDPKLSEYSPDCYAAAITEVARQKKASIILMGATYTGKDLMARVAQLLDSALAQDCIGYRVEGGKLLFKRPMYAGKAIAEVEVASSPVLATFRTKTFKPSENPVTSNVEKMSLELPEPLTVLEEVQSSATGKLDVTEADLIVSGGRGMKGPENWHLIEDLAKVLDAATGCSRPVSDEGWRPHDEHIGQTGKTVSPLLYISCAMSGAIQHLAGMSSSKYIVAINKDPEAPIFKVADYGIVGDVFDVLPVMIEEIKKIKAHD